MKKLLLHYKWFILLIGISLVFMSNALLPRNVVLKPTEENDSRSEREVLAQVESSEIRGYATLTGKATDVLTDEPLAGVPIEVRRNVDAEIKKDGFLFVGSVNKSEIIKTIYTNEYGVYRTDVPVLEFPNIYNLRIPQYDDYKDGRLSDIYLYPDKITTRDFYMYKVGYWDNGENERKMTEIIKRDSKSPPPAEYLQSLPAKEMILEAYEKKYQKSSPLKINRGNQKQSDLRKSDFSVPRKNITVNTECKFQIPDMLKISANSNSCTIDWNNLIEKPLDDVVTRILFAEVSNITNIEGLKAHAIASRTFAVKNNILRRNGRCQHAYSNVMNIPSDWVTASIQTSGIVLLGALNGGDEYKNIIDAFYAARCNGNRTLASEEGIVGAPGNCTGALPTISYLPSVTCSGHDSCEEVSGETPCCELIRQNETHFIYGHGVGLCQRGTEDFSENQSKTWDWILDHYYPNTCRTDGSTSLLSINTSTNICNQITDGVPVNVDLQNGSNIIWKYSLQPSWHGKGYEKLFSFSHSGGTIEVSVSNLTSGIDPDIRLFMDSNSDGFIDPLNESVGISLSETDPINPHGAKFENAPFGSYFVLVDNGSKNYGTCDISVSAICCTDDAYEPNNSISTPHSKAYPSWENPVKYQNGELTTIEASLCNSDIDKYELRVGSHALKKGCVQVSAKADNNEVLKVTLRKSNGVILQEAENDISVSIRNPIGVNEYTIEVSHANGSSGDIGNYDLFVYWYPQCNGANFTQPSNAPDAGPNLTACNGGDVQLQGNCPSGECIWFPTEHLLNPLDPMTIANPPTTTKYYFIDASFQTCAFIDSMTVTVSSLSVNANAGSDKYIQQGGGIYLSGNGGSSFSWSPSTGLSDPTVWNPYATPTSTTTYTLTVQDIYGCTDTDQMTVYVDNTGGGNAPSNDEPCDAVSLNATGNTCNTISGTNVGATGSSVSTPNTCASSSTSGNPSGDYNGGDIWYKLTVPSSGEFVVALTSPFSSTDMVAVFYSGTCTNLTEFACNDDQNPGLHYMPWYHVTNRTPEETIWVRVFEFGNNQEESFGICAYNFFAGGGNGPDLETTIISINNTNPDQGDLVDVRYRYENTGTQAISSAFVQGLYLSTNPYYDDGDDVPLGANFTLGLNVGESITVDQTITIPNEPDGQYYIVANLDVGNLIDEISENNNHDAEPIQIGDLTPNGPDLNVTRLIVTSSVPGFAPGQNIDVEIEVDNDGNQYAGDFDLLVVFDSNDNGDYDPAIDEELFTIPFNGGINPGYDETKNYDMFLPQNIASTGYYDIIAIADIGNEVSESDKSNNTKNRSIHISTTNPAGPDFISGFEYIEHDLTNVLISPFDLCLGEPYYIRYHITNIGNLDSNGPEQLTSRVWITEDGIIDGNVWGWDVSWHTENVDIGEVIYRSDDKEFFGFAPGQHYVHILADADDDKVEINEQNNITTFPIYINNCGIPLADLTGEFVSYTPFSSNLGDSITATFKVWNQGDVGVAGLRVSLMVSDDTIFDGDGDANITNEDYYLLDSGYTTIQDTLNPGDTIQLSLAGWSHSLTGTGAKYLFLAIDEDRLFNESNKENNFIPVPIEIVSTDCYYNTFSHPTKFNDTLSHESQSNWLRVYTKESCSYIFNRIENWINYPINESYTGGGARSFSIQANPTPFPRHGHIEVGTEIYEFIQLGAPCSQFTNGEYVECIEGVLPLEMMLEGPYNSLNSLMNDQLRQEGMIPLIEPYTGLGYSHIGGGGEVTSQVVLDVSGPDAIVDWVFIELRDLLDNASVVATQSALLQRDGDVVMVDGITPIVFAQPLGRFYVAVRHRNHLGAMALYPTQPNLNNGSLPIDFANSSVETFGNNGQRLHGDITMLWSGDANNDGVVDSGDRSIAWNLRNQTGYLQADMNMDGVVDSEERSIAWNNRNIGEQLP